LEIQIGSRAFVRGAADTQLGLENQEPDFLQIKITGGDTSFDLRAIEAFELWRWTPNAVFTIEHAGYYRWMSPAIALHSSPGEVAKPLSPLREGSRFHRGE